MALVTGVSDFDERKSHEHMRMFVRKRSAPWSPGTVCQRDMSIATAPDGTFYVFTMFYERSNGSLNDESSQRFHLSILLRSGIDQGGPDS